MLIEAVSASDLLGRWQVFATNSAGDYTSFSRVFSTTVTYSLLGFREYDTDVVVSLTPGFYALGFTTSDGNLSIGVVPNVLQSYPDPTIDGNFRVLGGARLSRVVFACASPRTVNAS